MIGVKFAHLGAQRTRFIYLALYDLPINKAGRQDRPAKRIAFRLRPYLVLLFARTNSARRWAGSPFILGNAVIPMLPFWTF